MQNPPPPPLPARKSFFKTLASWPKTLESKWDSFRQRRKIERLVRENLSRTEHKARLLRLASRLSQNAAGSGRAAGASPSMPVRVWRGLSRERRSLLKLKLAKLTL